MQLFIGFLHTEKLFGNETERLAAMALGDTDTKTQSKSNTIHLEAEYISMIYRAKPSLNCVTSH
jgi:hypothetical protein